ncbi:MAG: GNAT family N-acetyltransferase [Pseudomonadota bacterium]
MPDENSSLTMRAAAPDDADHLAQLINYAGEGMPLYLWERMAEQDETPWDVGRRRAKRTEGGFSYLNATVAEVDGEVAGCLIGYALPEEPEAIDYESMPGMFVPLQELENLAPATWYVNVLAVHPHLRGTGVGSALLQIADQRAAETGCPGLSIIVADANTGARRLYERSGYVEQATREMVKDDWDNPSTNWVLLTK